MQLVSGTDAEGLSAWYIGPESWTPPWLPGRTLTTQQAIAAVCAGEALQRRPPKGDPVWRTIHAGAYLLGLTVGDLAGVLDVDCEIPKPPSLPARPRLWLPGRG